MRLLKLFSIFAAFGCLSVGSKAFAVDFKTLFSALTGAQPFKKLQVSEVAALMANKSMKVAVFDANGPKVRSEEGVVPNATLLSSHDKYDIAKELPADKTTKLVFYCHNWM
jgi:hypothetical protein